MSSLLRTMQKNILKNQGFVRNKDGDILNPKGKVVLTAPRNDKGEPVGKARWPFYTKEPVDAA